MTRSNGLWFAERKQHIECGRHSGIPDCCIHLFVNRWLPIVGRYAESATCDSLATDRVIVTAYGQKLDAVNRELYAEYVRRNGYTSWGDFRLLARWSRNAKAFNYVPCDACLAKRQPVTLKSCECWARMIK